MYREIIKTFFTCFIITNLIGYLFIVQDSLSKYISDLESKFEIVIFVDKKEKTPEIIGEKIRKIANVQSAKFISKEEIKQKMSKFEKEIMSTDQRNPFPDTFSIRVAKIRKDFVSNLYNKLMKISGIDEVNYDKNLIEIRQSALNFFRITNYVLMIVFFSIFIVFVLSIVFEYKVVNIAFVKNKILYLHMLTGLIGSLIGIVTLYILMSFVLKNDIEQYGNLNLRHILIIFLCAIFIILIRTVAQYRTITRIRFQ